MNKYAIYTEGDVYPVLEKDGQYYIGVPNTGHFSGDWKFLGVRERLKNNRVIIKPEDALKITDWQFKNGSPRYQVVDLDHGTVRTWAGTAANQQLRSFDTISDNGFSLATKTDNDKEVTLEESKKYAIYVTYGGDGVYNSKLVDTVDSEEQAVDRVAELQATGVGASYEEVETKNEECSQASGVASGTNGKIDSFPINPKEMEKQRLKEDIENPYFVVEDIGGLYIMAGPFKTKEEAEKKMSEQIKEYNLEEEAGIIYAWDWNTIHKYYIDRYKEDTYSSYSEFINGAACAPYYKEAKLEESKRLSEGKKIDISNFEDVNYCVAGTKDMLYSDDVSNVTFVSTEEEAKEQIKAYEQQGLKYSAYKDITDIKNIILNIVDRFKNNSNLKFEVDTTVFIRYSDNKIIIGMINYSLDISKTDINKYNYVNICLHDYTPAEYNKYSGHTEYFVFSDNKKLKSIPNKNIDSVKDAEEEMINYIRQWLGTDYTEEDDDNDILFEALKELINYLNKNTKYNWDANEMYDNCAITESDTDYIEVFVDIKDGNKIYTVDNYSYNSLEELVKNMPILFTDEDEDYDYDSNWEDLDESKNDKNLDWIYDENEKLYHCEIDNWYFNIYELEDGTYNLIVDYDEDELQDLDDIFDTLEEAKKKAQEIFNKGISEYNDTDFAGFEYETESKDLTETLQEIALLEDYEEDKTISPQKQKFIDYCKDKIEDLGDIEIYDEDYEENIQYHKLMHTEGIREFNDLYIIANFEEYDENLKAINSENKMVIDTPMIDCNGYAATMQFDEIDQEYYHTLLEYWNDLYMDEMIEEE